MDVDALKSWTTKSIRASVWVTAPPLVFLLAVGFAAFAGFGGFGGLNDFASVPPIAGEGSPTESAIVTGELATLLSGDSTVLDTGPVTTSTTTTIFTPPAAAPDPGDDSPNPPTTSRPTTTLLDNLPVTPPEDVLEVIADAADDILSGVPGTPVL